MEHPPPNASGGSHWNQVTLYRCDCDDCDATEAELKRLCDSLHALLTIRRVEETPALREMAGWSTPVVCVNGRVITSYEFSVKKWRRAIESGVSAAPTKLVGDVVCMSCYLEGLVKGGENAPCAKRCVSRGGPAGLLMRPARLYLLVRDDEDTDEYDRLAGLSGKHVVVSGDLLRRGGLEAISIETIRPISESD